MRLRELPGAFRRVLAQRVRKWADSALDEERPEEHRQAPSSAGTSLGAGQPHDAPPAHWIERVRRGAPQLLVQRRGPTPEVARKELRTNVPGDQDRKARTLVARLSTSASQEGSFDSKARQEGPADQTLERRVMTAAGREPDPAMGHVRSWKARFGERRIFGLMRRSGLPARSEADPAGLGGSPGRPGGSRGISGSEASFQSDSKVFATTRATAPGMGSSQERPRSSSISPPTIEEKATSPRRRHATAQVVTEFATISVTADRFSSPGTPSGETSHGSPRVELRGPAALAADLDREPVLWRDTLERRRASVPSSPSSRLSIADGFSPQEDPERRWPGLSERSDSQTVDELVAVFRKREHLRRLAQEQEGLPWNA